MCGKNRNKNKNKREPIEPKETKTNKMPKQQTEKVNRAFDYSKFDNIDISDDEDSFHPNIEKNFNIRINRTVRERKIGDMDTEKASIKEMLSDKNERAVQQELEKEAYQAAQEHSSFNKLNVKDTEEYRKKLL